MSVRRYRQEARTKCIQFSPTVGRGRLDRGTLDYSLDESVAFDPFDLSIDLTPQAVLDVLAEREPSDLAKRFRCNAFMKVFREATYG